jgi:hypothetical protein
MSGLGFVAFGVFLNPEFFYVSFVRAGAACSSREFGGSSTVKLVIEFVLGLVVGAIALWWIVAEMIEDWCRKRRVLKRRS